MGQGLPREFGFCPSVQFHTAGDLSNGFWGFGTIWDGQGGLPRLFIFVGWWLVSGDGTRAARMTALFKKGMPVREIANSFGVQNPAVWKALRRTGALPPYAESRTSHGGRPKGGGKPGYTDRRLEKSAAHISRVEAGQPPVSGNYVDRDPCWMCGVRGDLGCSHRGVTP